MSEKMTTVIAYGTCGLSFYGERSVAEAIADYRKQAAHDLEQAQRVLNAADEDFHVYTHRGIHVQKDKRVLQKGYQP